MQAGTLTGLRAEIVGTFADPSRWLKYIAAILIILLAAITRLPSPWRMDVTNDEMLHLESYRNHYRTDDIPLIYFGNWSAQES